MSRSARRTTPIPPVREWRTLPPLVVSEEMMRILECCRTKLDDLIREGMPVLNLACERRAGKSGRTRRSLRFEVPRVLAWLRDRNGDGVE